MTFTETFEDDDAGELPADENGRYVFRRVGTSSFFVDGNSRITGNNSLFYAGQTGGSHSAMEFDFQDFYGSPALEDFCDDLTGDFDLRVRFKFMVTELRTTLTFNVMDDFSVGGTFDGYRMTINTAGSITMTVVNDASSAASSALALPTAVTINTVYDVQFRDISDNDCDDSFTLHFFNYDGQGDFQFSFMGGGASGPTGDLINQFHVGGESRSASGPISAVFIDDLTFSGFPLPPPAFTPSTSISVTNLVGFDVDPTGTNIIARTNLAGGVGTSISVMDAQLLTIINTEASNCDDFDGVNARATHIAYLSCASGGGVIEAIEFRGPSLETPVFPGCSWCGDDVPIENDAAQLSQFQPILRIVNQSLLGVDTSYAWQAIAFTADNNRDVGILTNTERKNSVDSTRFADQQEFYSLGGADQMCAMLGDQETTNEELRQTYIAVAGSQLKIYRVDYFTTGITGTNARILEATLANVFTGTGGLGNTRGVSCSNEDLILVQTDEPAGDRAVLVNYQTGVSTPVRTDVTFPSTRGVALTRDGNFATVIDSSTGFVYNLNTLNIVSQFTIPAGTFREVRMDATGGNVWVATSTSIARFDVSTTTCIDSCGIVGEEQTGSLPEPTEGTGTGLFAGAGEAVGDAMGVGAFGGGLFLGAVLMGLVSFGVGSGGGALLEERGQSRFRFSWPGAAIGAAVGFLMAWGFDLFTDAAAYTVVVLSAISLLIVGFFRSR